MKLQWPYKVTDFYIFLIFLIFCPSFVNCNVTFEPKSITHLQDCHADLFFLKETVYKISKTCDLLPMRILSIQALSFLHWSQWFHSYGEEGHEQLVWDKSKGYQIRRWSEFSQKYLCGVFTKVIKLICHWFIWVIHFTNSI